MIDEEGGEDDDEVGVQEIVGAAYNGTAKKWQTLPPSTQRCQIAWLL